MREVQYMAKVVAAATIAQDLNREPEPLTREQKQEAVPLLMAAVSDLSMVAAELAASFFGESGEPEGGDK